MLAHRCDALASRCFITRTLLSDSASRSRKCTSLSAACVSWNPGYKDRRRSFSEIRMAMNGVRYGWLVATIRLSIVHRYSLQRASTVCTWVSQDLDVLVEPRSPIWPKAVSENGVLFFSKLVSEACHLLKPWRQGCRTARGQGQQLKHKSSTTVAGCGQENAAEGCAAPDVRFWGRSTPSRLSQLTLPTTVQAGISTAAELPSKQYNVRPHLRSQKVHLRFRTFLRLAVGNQGFRDPRIVGATSAHLRETRRNTTMTVDTRRTATHYQDLDKG